jgi:putative transposase
MFAQHVDVDETGDITMAMGRPKAELILSEDERSQLMSIARSRSISAALVTRARIILGSG